MPAIETSLPLLMLLGVFAYLLGSVPFGLVVTKVFGLGDPRQIGSGNIGATNVLRTGSKSAGALTLLLDGAKGAVAVLIARAVAGEDAAQLAALLAFIGHCYPVWLKFKGGKGVATFLGVLLALVWPVGLLVCATWLAAVALTRISSMGALVCASSSTLWMLLLGRGEALLLGMILTLMVFYRHRANISRLRAGQEPKVGQKS